MLMLVFLLILSTLHAAEAANGCSTPERKDQMKLAYSAEPYSNGTYPKCAKVTATCSGGSVRSGGREAVCTSRGSWYPRLGHCPRACPLSDLVTKKGYSNTQGFRPVPHPDPYSGEKILPHGRGAYGYCLYKVPILEWYYEWHYWFCDDGEWKPWSTKKQNC